MVAEVQNLPAKRRQPLNPLYETWLYFCENKGALAGLIVIVTLCLLAIFAGLIVPFSPIDQYPDCQLMPPIWQDRDPADFAACTNQAHFLLGTDPAGRDMLSRLIWGGRMSLLMGLVPVFVATAIGGTLGVVAGFVGGRLCCKYRTQCRVCHLMRALCAGRSRSAADRPRGWCRRSTWRAPGSRPAAPGCRA